MSDWMYYLLQNKSGMLVGFMRVRRNGPPQYADLRARRWQHEAIAYSDRVALKRPPLGLRALEGTQ
jgi:hypothetical protein